MKTRETARFLLGAALFSPLLATEDALRYFGAPVSKHGLTKNDDGKGIMEIWKECAPPVPVKVEEPKPKKVTRVVVDNEASEIVGEPVSFVIPEGF